MEQNAQGPFSYRNWKSALAGEDWYQIFEYPLFTDARITDEIVAELGPYQIINNTPMQFGRPMMILRVEEHLNSEPLPMDNTQDADYHGGFESDEIAALLSLCLGVRMKAGGASRVFGKGSDPMGRPIGWGFSTDPNLANAIPRDEKKTILKNAIGQHHIKDAMIIATLPSLSAVNARALIRAARMYQEAIWIIENTPELSWIMFTSAIETVANRWRSGKSSNIEKMRISRPKLEGILRIYAGDKADELVNKVADEIAPTLGAIKTFVDFIIEFLPQAPLKRPPPFAQVTWETSAMQTILKRIYDCRSLSLHGGRPFPAPMCQPPYVIGDQDILSEIPIASATQMKGSVWMSKDIPILLHTFEYICRNAILKWWKSATHDNIVNGKTTE